MIVFAAMRGAPDYSAPPPALVGITETEEAALALLTSKYSIQEWKNSLELQAYFIIDKYDTTTGKRI